MAQKRPRRRSQRGAPDADAPSNPSAASAAAAHPAASGKQWPPGTGAAARPARREVRPYIYAGLDFVMAVVYALVLLQAPTRHALHATLLWSTVGAVGLAGAGMLWRSRWGWRAAAAGCALLLLLAVSLLVLILLSASFLAGVYGSMGRGAASMALLAGALVIEIMALLPAFQLKFLMTRAGRRHYARAAGPAR
jgi:hypothetical protein